MATAKGRCGCQADWSLEYFFFDYLSSSLLFSNFLVSSVKKKKRRRTCFYCRSEEKLFFFFLWWNFETKSVCLVVWLKNQQSWWRSGIEAGGTEADPDEQHFCFYFSSRFYPLSLLAGAKKKCSECPTVTNRAKLGGGWPSLLLCQTSYSSSSFSDLHRPLMVT